MLSRTPCCPLGYMCLYYTHMWLLLTPSHLHHPLCFHGLWCLQVALHRSPNWLMFDENWFLKLYNMSSFSIFIQRWSLMPPLIYPHQKEMLSLTHTYACPARFSNNSSNNMTNSCFKIHFSKGKSFYLSDIQLFTLCPWECWKKSVYYQEIIS